MSVFGFRITYNNVAHIPTVFLLVFSHIVPCGFIKRTGNILYGRQNKSLFIHPIYAGSKTMIYRYHVIPFCIYVWLPFQLTRLIQDNRLAAWLRMTADMWAARFVLSLQSDSVLGEDIILRRCVYKFLIIECCIFSFDPITHIQSQIKWILSNDLRFAISIMF